MAFLDAIGARERLVGPAHARFPFIDLKAGRRWTLRPNDGRIGWWVLFRDRRVPDTRVGDYVPLLKLLRAAPDAAIGDVIDCSGPLYERLVEPLLVAALNTEPPLASAKLAAAVIRETLAAGGRSYRPLVARDGLSSAFVDPALAYLRGKGAHIQFGQRLRAFTGDDGRVTGLDFGDNTLALGREDSAILAVPPVVAGPLLPGLQTPTEFRAILNVHFRLDPPADIEPITGVVNGTVEWLFAFPGRLSVTISCADRLLDTPREELAGRIWQEVAAIAGVATPMPPWQIVRERRATFAALPDQEARRPGATTGFRNLFLAGDWTDTGLPATIEGAIRSGNRAADLVAHAG